MNTLKKVMVWIFFILLCLTLLTPLWIFKDLLFPFITSKAFYFRIIVELAVPFYAYLVITYKEYRPSLKSPLNILVLVFLGLNIVSAILGVNTVKSFWGNFERMGGVYYLAHLTLLYFYVLLLGVINAKYLRRFLQAFVGMGVITTLYGILVWFKILAFLPDPSYPRISSTFGNPIFFASFLILPIFLSVFFAVESEVYWKKIIYWGVVLLQLWGIFLSVTRGAVVGLVLGLGISAIIYILLTKVRRVKYVGIVVLGVFLTGAVLLFSFSSKLPQGSAIRRVVSLKDGNTEARLIQWKTALRGFHERPILGVGAENYYVIANKYYDPAIYNYDRSWFDKPHNYLIEVLVTNGILGFLTYLGVVVFSIIFLYRSYKGGWLSLEEFCILLAGLLTYQFQNFFVFDTISASIAYFIYAGFIGYLGNQSVSVQNKKQMPAVDKNFSYAVFGIVCIIMAYVVYETNVVSLALAKNVNYGYAYASVDPNQSKIYFGNAVDLPYIMDPIELGSKYIEFAIIVLQNPHGLSQPEVDAIVDRAFDIEKSALKSIPNDASSWQRLANLYLTKSIIGKTNFPPEGEEAVNEAVSLAPLRPELQLLLARVKLFQNDIPGAESVLKSSISAIPKNDEAKMQLALLYWYTKRGDQGAKLAEDALSDKYSVTRSNEILWLADYYRQQKRFDDAIRIYKIAIGADGQNIDIYWQLAQTYAQAGDKANAIAMAQAIKQADPTKSKEIDSFIESLK